MILRIHGKREEVQQVNFTEFPPHVLFAYLLANCDLPFHSFNMSIDDCATPFRVHDGMNIVCQDKGGD